MKSWLDNSSVVITGASSGIGKELAKLLIEKATFWDKGRYSLKKDRNKMSVVGFVFYLSNILIILLTIIFLFIPDIPCKPLVIDATKIYLYADTLNAKIPIICAMVLLCSECLFFLIQLLKFIKGIHGRWVKILSVVISIFGIVVSGAVIIEMTIELFQ